MSTLKEKFAQIGKLAGKSAINLALASLMNENDVKMFGGLKFQPKYFTKSEKDLIKKFFPDIIKNKVRGNINITLATAKTKQSDIIFSEVTLFKDNEFKALKDNYGKIPGNKLFLVLQKTTDSNTTNKSKRPPILQFIDNKFKLKLTLRIATGDFISISSSKQIGKDLIGKSEFYTLMDALDGGGIRKTINSVITDKKITDNDFLNNTTIKSELEHFASELKSIFDVSESGKSELEILFNQAKSGRIESVNVFEKMKLNIIKLFKTKSKLIDTSKNTKIEILLQQPVTVEFKFSSENGPQDNRGFPMFSSIIIDFKQLKITGYYKDLGGNKNNITTFSSSIQYLKKLPKEFTNPNNNDFKLNEKFIMVLLLALKNSPQEFKDNMQLHF